MTAFSPLKPKTVAWTGRVAKDSWPEASEPPGQRIVDRAIGAIIREVRDISDSQVEQILAYQREQGLRFGDAAVACNNSTTRMHPASARSSTKNWSLQSTPSATRRKPFANCAAIC